ncbi:kinetochore-associated Ndc80 complex subunit nuf2 [Dissophora ornata]|nr:kinetochore-associated Ndc80 complex subunit nuf2 [Dissophora ornata]
MGRSGSSIPRPTGSTNSNSKLNASDLHLPRSAKEVYHFPLLKLEAIVSCLKDVEVSSTEDELARPTPQKMLLVYETFLDIVTGKLRDDCILDDIQSMDITAYPEFLIDGVRFYVFLYQLAGMMHEVGVSDFTSRDMTKPEAERVRRVLSAVINFAKFKEDRQGFFLDELKATEDIVMAIENSDREHEYLTMELETLKQRKLAQEPKVEEQKAINQHLDAELEVYKKREFETKKQKDEVIKERMALSERHKELTTALEKATKDLTALQAQRVDVPETLEQDLVQIPQSIFSVQTQIDQHRKQSQGRYADVERMESVPRDLAMVLEVMHDTMALLDNSQRDASGVDSVKSQIERESLTVSTCKTRLDQNERQTKNLEEKSASLMRTQQSRRTQQEMESMEQEKSRQEAEEKLMESRRALEEARRRQVEIIQREEKWAQEVAAAMENLKHQFECYGTEVLQALRTN